mmetsp:Transcript_10365/g.13256  ORF Transcript_10365/g.13256 Transcript_10365/m.13256 type:complete len:93 (-) Transcript_10365:255-533(-)
MPASAKIATNAAMAATIRTISNLIMFSCGILRRDLSRLHQDSSGKAGNDGFVTGVTERKSSQQLDSLAYLYHAALDCDLWTDCCASGCPVQL